MNKIFSRPKLKKKVDESHFTVEYTVSIKYRVSHETWQLVNSLKCLLP